MRSILEVPLLNDRYWAKIPACDTDAVMLDLEDSVHLDAKVAARERLAGALHDRAFFGDRRVIVRINDLSTPWGRDDLEALRPHLDHLVICYPKADSSAEVEEVVRRAGAGNGGGLLVMIETARGVLDVVAIARTPGVVGLHFGYTDYADDIGARAYAPSGDDLHAAMTGVRADIARVAAAFGLFASGGSMIPDHRDGAKVERFARSWIEAGYTTMLAISPSHLDPIRRAFSPSENERRLATRMIADFEDARSKGRVNAVSDGTIVTEAVYRRALRTIGSC